MRMVDGVILNIKGQRIEVTLEEARQLHAELGNIFHEPSQIIPIGPTWTSYPERTTITSASLISTDDHTLEGCIN
jgi:hypothetical protein